MIRFSLDKHPWLEVISYLQHKYILQNAVFLVDKILPLVQDRYTEKTGFRFPRAAEIQFILQKIRTVAKTTVGEFVWCHQK